MKPNVDRLAGSKSRVHWKDIYFYKVRLMLKKYMVIVLLWKEDIHAEIKPGDSVLIMSDELPHIYC